MWGWIVCLGAETEGNGSEIWEFKKKKKNTPKWSSCEGGEWISRQAAPSWEGFSSRLEQAGIVGRVPAHGRRWNWMILNVLPTQTDPRSRLLFLLAALQAPSASRLPIKLQEFRCKTFPTPAPARSLRGSRAPSLWRTQKFVPFLPQKPQIPNPRACREWDFVL